MIRSATAVRAKWKDVPPGFQIAWGDVDTSMFAQRSRIAAGAETVRQAILAAADAGRIGYATLCWHAADQLRDLRRRSREATRRVIRIGQTKRLNRHWNVVVQISVQREARFVPERLAA